VAKDRLSSATGCVVALIGGAAAEHAVPGTSAILELADYAVGAALALSGAWLVWVERQGGWLALMTAAAWFAGTAAGSTNLPAYGGDVAALAYRGFLIDLFLRAVAQRHALRGSRVLTVAGYASVLAPAPAGDALTAVIMGILTSLTVLTARRVPRDGRQFLFAVIPTMAALAVTWAVTATSTFGGSGVQFVNDLLILNATAVLLVGSSAESWVHGAINGLVVELGPSRGDARVSTLLARVMADPDLEVRYSVSGIGWFDDSGAPAEAPGTGPEGQVRPVTRVSTAGGGEVALIHGLGAASPPAMAEAAAAAAALSLDNALVTAEMRHRAGDRRRSLRRLLNVADTERQVLEAQLRAGPAGRLQRVDGVLAGLDDPSSALIRDQLASALDDLGRLAQGLYPVDLDGRPFGEVLQGLVKAAAVPVRLITDGIDELPDELRAVTYFFLAECLTNVGRHSQATAATVEVKRDERRLVMSVLDNGRGGAALTGSRGLRSLADRIEAAGGRLSIESPVDGPTCILADIPLG
jgi:hypothetical protein